MYLHVREATGVARAEGIEAFLADGPDSDLEQGRSKLLLAPPPRAYHLRTELEKRHQLWRHRDWEALLVRAEAQAIERVRGRSMGQDSLASRGQRAKRLAREQAYRKGVTALTGSSADLSATQQQQWARTLLPPSSLSSGGVVPLGGDPKPSGLLPTPEGEAAADIDEIGDASAQSDSTAHAPTSLWQQALRGVRFPALSGAGPSGARPEHLREALLAKKDCSHEPPLAGSCRVWPLAACWRAAGQCQMDP